MFARIRHSRAGRAGLAAALLGMLGAIGGGTVISTQVLGAKLSAPPAPVITATPSASTSSTTAPFTYTDSEPNATFQCSLDGAKFAGCPTTGISYSGLSNGHHTFDVTAKLGTSASSPAASWAWTVDTQAPVVALSFPKAGQYNAAAWNSGCSSPGICGTATDATSVSEVQVAVRQASSAKYWDGSGFSSTTETYRQATGVGAWSLALPLPADGSYTVKVRAIDSLANGTPAGSETSAAFVVDSFAPPTPAITGQPEDPTFSANATFSYSDAESGVAFQCSLDTAGFTSCPAGSISYTKLTESSHTFRVRAVDTAGNSSQAAIFTWTVVTSTAFSVSGTVGRLAPGVELPIDLTIKNPYSVAISVDRITVAILDATTKDGQPNQDCVGTVHLTVTRGFTGPVTVPANGTVTVTGDARPLVKMLDLDSNQDACKGTTFSFAYSGSATKA